MNLVPTDEIVGKGKMPNGQIGHSDVIFEDSEVQM